MHIDAVRHFFLADLKLDMGFLLPKLDNFPILGISVGLGGSAQVDRLQSVRLSLGIVPVKNIRPGAKANLQRSVISVSL